MNTMEPLTIHPGTNLAKELPAEQFGEVMEWFRSNGIEPNGVPPGEPVVIEHQIDFWWRTTPQTPEPEGAHTLERTFASGEFPISHHQIAVTNPLPEDLESILRGLAARWDAVQAELSSKLMGLNLPCPNCGHKR